MFKNMIIYRIAESWQSDLQVLEDALQKTVFAGCGATQERSVGWVPPRDEAHGPLVESVAGQWVMRFMTEAKVLPASVLNRKVNEKVEHIEKTEGRKPGKKEKRELKDEAKLDLLPMAFTKQGSMWVWIDPQARTLVLDTSAQGRADEVVTLLVEGLPGFAVALLDTQTSAQAAMAHWLMTQEPPAGFTADRETELKAADESKAVVRYARHPLDIDEVRQHIEHGKLPTKLAMTWDDRVRSRLMTVCNRGQQLGWLDFNPVEPTKKPKAKTMRQRLTLEQFKSILAAAPQVAEWLPGAMLVALLSGMDRDTLAGLERKAIGSEALTIHRAKTGVWVEIPLRLRMDEMAMTLSEALAACRSNVVSRYVVHHRRTYRAEVKAGSSVHVNRISKAFKEARELAGITGDDAPTFHEIRSLAKRTYMAQGNVDTKALLGHTSEKTAAIYADPRGAEPIRVKVS